MNKIKHIIVRSVLVVLLVAVGGGNLYAQKSQLSGTVSDAENTPLVGASIIVEGTHVGTTTDADGAFRLPAAPGQRLTVSYLGYKSKTVTVGSRTSRTSYSKATIHSSTKSWSSATTRRKRSI